MRRPAADVPESGPRSLEAARREERIRRSAAFQASTDILNRGSQHAQRQPEATWLVGASLHERPGELGDAWVEWPQAVEEEAAVGLEARRLVRRLQREKRDRERRRREQALREAELLAREAEEQQHQREEARQRMEREREEARRRRHEEHRSVPRPGGMRVPRTPGADAAGRVRGAETVRP